MLPDMEENKLAGRGERERRGKRGEGEGRGRKRGGEGEAPPSSISEENIRRHKTFC